MHAESLVLGRYSSSDSGDAQEQRLLFRHKSVSRRHAMIRAVGTGDALAFTIQALSKNGVHVNGVPLGPGDEEELDDTDLVRFGRDEGAVEFRFRIEGTGIDDRLPLAKLLVALEKRTKADGLVAVRAVRALAASDAWPSGTSLEPLLDLLVPGGQDGWVSAPELVAQLHATAEVDQLDLLILPQILTLQKLEAIFIILKL